MNREVVIDYTQCTRHQTQFQHNNSLVLDMFFFYSLSHRLAISPAERLHSSL